MKNKKKLGLTTLIFIALIAGAITGIIINYVFLVIKSLMILLLVVYFML